MFYSLIILTAVINFANTQETPELDSVAVLSGLSSSNLDCSLKFGRDFIANNEDVANAIEALIGNDDSTREPKPREARDVTREPCEEGEDCSRGRGGHRGRGRGRRDSSSDSSEEVDATEVPADSTDAEADIELRRNLGRGRRGRRRGDVTREPLADGETREPRQTREPRDATKEPCENGEDCRRRHRRRRDDDSTKEPCDDDETSENPAESSDAIEADIEIRRNLGRGRRGRRRGDVTPEPLADGETREPRQTREPRDATKEPCDDGENCQRRRRRRRDDDSTKEPCDDDSTEAPESSEDAIPALRRLLRGGNRATREPLADGQTHEPRDVTKEPRGHGRGRGRRDRGRGRRGRGRGRRDSDSEDATDEPATEAPVQLRRALRKGGRRGSNLDATISNGIVEVAGIEGTVVFGEVDETMESIPLTLTLGEVVFTCDVRVRGNEGDRVSCRATSEDDFKVRIGCAIETNEEQ